MDQTHPPQTDDLPDEMTGPPASVDEFRTRLADILDDLPRRLRQCADYIAANTDRITAEGGTSAPVASSATVDTAMRSVLAAM